MAIHSKLTRPADGFTVIELLIAIAVCGVFVTGVFATNQRVLIAVKSQKEAAAATMMLQERMENFRATAYSNIGNLNYVQTNIVQQPTTSEAALGALNETITVSGYLTTSGAPGYGTDGSTPNQWIRNSQYPNGNNVSQYSADLATDYNLIQVDILIRWTSTDGRIRSRDLTAIFGKGNVGQ